MGDALEECQLWLFADADHAGEHDSKSSTFGCAMILVGPNTYFPLLRCTERKAPGVRLPAKWQSQGGSFGLERPGTATPV